MLARRVIQHVVDKLERDAEIEAVDPQRLFLHIGLGRDARRDDGDAEGDTPS